MTNNLEVLESLNFEIETKFFSFYDSDNGLISGFSFLKIRNKNAEYTEKMEKKSESGFFNADYFPKKSLKKSLDREEKNKIEDDKRKDLCERAENKLKKYIEKMSAKELLELIYLNANEIIK